MFNKQFLNTVTQGHFFRVRLSFVPIPIETGPAVWGEPGRFLSELERN